MRENNNNLSIRHKSGFHVFSGFLFTLLLFSCSTNREGISGDKIGKNMLEGRLSHSGGIPANKTLCPESPYDTIVPVSQLDPPPQPGQPHMSIDGLHDFMLNNDIGSIEQLINTFPEHYRNNFSLVEHTKATGQSNLKYPRIVLFGSDGRFLLNIGTKPDDPKYHLLDVAQLDEDTGDWEFSVFDFNGVRPKLTRNDPNCIECHGKDNARPFWGTNLDWPGVFGDNIAEGPQGEALDARHAERMNEIKSGKGESARFNFLTWNNETLRRGAKRKIANHVFGAELLVSNIAMGSATSRGSFIRLSKRFPKKYKALREELLLAYYLKKGNAYLSHQEAGIYSELAELLDIKEADLDSMLKSLGLYPNEAFSLGTLAEKEPPMSHWSMGKGDLYDMLMLQVLDDIRKDDHQIENILARRSVAEAIIDCPDTASSISEVVDFKMLHLFHLKGSARYQVNRVYYPLDIEDIYDRVFLPVSSKMIPYLKKSIDVRIN